MSRLRKYIHESVLEAVAVALSPKRWASAKVCSDLYGLSRAVLNSLAAKGEIRKCKTSDAEAAGALYRCADIEEWMEERASRGVGA